MKIKEKVICFIDVLGFFSFLKLLALSGCYEFSEVRYCSATLPIKLFKAILPAKFKEFDYELGNIFWKEDESIFWLEYEELTRFSIELFQKSPAAALLVNHLNNRYNKAKIRLYLNQRISLLTDEALRLILIARYCMQSAKCLVLTRGLPWSNEIAAYADKQGIATATYFDVKDVVAPIFIFLKFVMEGLCNLLLLPFAFSSPESKKPTVGVCYLNSIEPDRRNDLFWYKQGSFAPENILVYFKSPLHPLTKELKDKIETKGFRSVNLSLFDARNPLSKLTRKINLLASPEFLAGIFSKLGESLRLFVSIPGKDAAMKLWQWNQLALLLNKVNFYEAFFKKYNVKIHFSLFGVGEDQTAANIAMDINGGVDVATHWSNFPMLLLDQVTSHDVYFCWGPYHEKLFKKYPFRVEHFRQSGYMYASTFSALRDRAQRHRYQLQKEGAKFIVTFFDEQHEKNGWLTKSFMEENYQALLTKVVDDPDFGLIIKTKKRAAVFALNNPSINSLLQSALNTKRCLLMDKNQLPNEAGQAADVTLGLGVFNTAVLECAFCNIPFITVERAGSQQHPYYEYGRDKIVFSDINAAIRRLDALKNNPAELKGMLSLGKLPSLLKEIDPFQDGKTSDRISSYLKTLLDGFAEGKSKAQCLKE